MNDNAFRFKFNLRFYQLVEAVSRVSILVPFIRTAPIEIMESFFSFNPVSSVSMTTYRTSINGFVFVNIERRLFF